MALIDFKEKNLIARFLDAGGRFLSPEIRADPAEALTKADWKLAGRMAYCTFDLDPRELNQAKLIVVVAGYAKDSRIFAWCRIREIRTDCEVIKIEFPDETKTILLDGNMIRQI